MATILTVHGTNASGPREGNHWWQQGSPFEAEMRRLVEGEDGKLDVAPIVWDGANSELSRQAAGSLLLGSVTELEDNKEPYCIIGHSHGGSIIAGALIAATQRARPLAALSRWITVGTPFIASRRKRLLFSRLGPLGKAVYLAVMTYSIGLIYGLIVYGSRNEGESFSSHVTTAVLGGAIFSLPAVALYFMLRWHSARKLPWHLPKAQSAAADTYGAKWLSLWHEDDEAIRGLASLKAMNIPFFARDFAVPAVSLLATLAVPMIAIGFLLTYKPSLPTVEDVQAVAEQHQQAPAAQGPAAKSGGGAPAKQTSAPSTATGAKDKPVGSGDPDKSNDLSPLTIVLGAVLMLLGPPAFAAGFAITILYFFRMLARPTSGWLSHRLNALTSLGNAQGGAR